MKRQAAAHQASSDEAEVISLFIEKEVLDMLKNLKSIGKFPISWGVGIYSCRNRVQGSLLEL